MYLFQNSKDSEFSVAAVTTTPAQAKDEETEDRIRELQNELCDRNKVGGTYTARVVLIIKNECKVMSAVEHYERTRDSILRRGYTPRSAHVQYFHVGN